jgi:hypothetical protein
LGNSVSVKTTLTPSVAAPSTQISPGALLAADLIIPQEFQAAPFQMRDTKERAEKVFQAAATIDRCTRALQLLRATEWFVELCQNGEEAFEKMHQYRSAKQAIAAARNPQ